MHEMTLLGHQCTDKGILPEVKKCNAIRNYPVPHDAVSARRFIAFSNCYRRFIINFADLSRHLPRLCKKNVPFEWSSECKNSFQYLKDKRKKPTLLQ